jgi:hypothetical protein
MIKPEYKNSSGHKGVANNLITFSHERNHHVPRTVPEPDDPVL